MSFSLSDLFPGSGGVRRSSGSAIARQVAARIDDLRIACHQHVRVALGILLIGGTFGDGAGVVSLRRFHYCAELRQAETARHKIGGERASCDKFRAACG
jgi:hypothetical protein